MDDLFNPVQNTDFGTYVTYCKNKPTSDNARMEYEAFFSKRQNEFGQKLSIEDLLITPVQRLPKYQLLIRVSVQALLCNNYIIIYLHTCPTIVHSAPCKLRVHFLNCLVTTVLHIIS